VRGLVKVWKSFLTVVPFRNNPLGLEPSGRGRHRMSYLGGDGDIDRPSPMKPRFVKIDFNFRHARMASKVFQRRHSHFTPKQDDDQPDDFEFGGKVKLAFNRILSFPRVSKRKVKRNSKKRMKKVTIEKKMKNLRKHLKS